VLLNVLDTHFATCLIGKIVRNVHDRLIGKIMLEFHSVTQLRLAYSIMFRFYRIANRY